MAGGAASAEPGYELGKGEGEGLESPRHQRPANAPRTHSLSLPSRARALTGPRLRQGRDGPGRKGRGRSVFKGAPDGDGRSEVGRRDGVNLAATTTNGRQGRECRVSAPPPVIREGRRRADEVVIPGMPLRFIRILQEKRMTHHHPNPQSPRLLALGLPSFRLAFAIRDFSQPSVQGLALRAGLI